MINCFNQNFGENGTWTLCSKTFSRKPCYLRTNVEKYVRARYDTDVNIMCKCIACWITIPSDT